MSRLTKESEDLIAKSIKKISMAYSKLDPHGVWACVGSRPLDIVKPNSDIDLLFFSAKQQSFERYVGELSGVRVSACLVPYDFLREDSYFAKYGGYFAAKLFSPYLLISDNTALKNLVKAAPAIYFLPYIEYRGRQTSQAFDIEKITAIALVSFLGICPDFDSYFLRQFSDDNFSNIWQMTVSQFRESFKAADVSLDLSLNNLELKSNLEFFENEEDMIRNKIDRVASHWSFATYTHGGNYNFYREYQILAREYINAQGGYSGELYKKMVKFIKSKSGQSEIFS